jgi:hypothetical protein
MSASNAGFDPMDILDTKPLALPAVRNR